MKRIVSYKIGVDVLGFPLYVIHKIHQDKPTETKNQPNKRWLKVVTFFAKQH
ncbi:hypothetical protein KHA90_24745 [Flavobacterium psychroterrae]|uniref:Uncharacterized protein n=1 Tax=Flavobacterium psychroterrae TaxID=2133767 RepID=A0ABS5PK12_9FLAO|nr:hypothetical protein [Flavobacterium psychroterrae]MBS7234215.1 hypothetical protein [Flavobacterium psychroterrae]